MFGKKPKGAVEKDRTSSGLGGLLWMFVGSILTIMIGVFLYLSPVFNFNPVGQNEGQVPKQVEPKINVDKDNGDYEFYDVLPNQDTIVVPETAVVVHDKPLPEEVASDFKPDVVVTAPKDTEQVEDNQRQEAERSDISGDGEITVVEDENETYDGGLADTDTTPKTDERASNIKIQRADTASQPPVTYILQINSFNNAEEADRRRAQVLMAGIDATVVKKLNNDQVIYQVVSPKTTSKQEIAKAHFQLQNNGIDSLIIEQRH